MKLSLQLRPIGIIFALAATLGAAALWVRSWQTLWVLPVAFIAALFVFFILPWALFETVGLIYSSRKKKPETHSRFAYFLFMYGYALILAICNVRVHVSGREKVPDVPFLFVSNHRSNFDNILSAAALADHPIAFISKPENFKIPVGGHFMKREHYIAIDRSDVAQSFAAFMAAAKLPSIGMSVGVYPEGTRSKTTEMGELHDGCFIIAKKAPMPILVTTVSGTQNIHKNAPWRRTDVYFDILEVIPVETVRAERPGALSARALEAMKLSITKRKEEYNL